MVTVMVAAVIFYYGSNAQKVYYSPPERNLPSETKTYIIGNVGGNILIWKYVSESRSSQILVYNENMHLLRRMDADVFESDNISQLQFINRQTSFDVIAQVHNRQSFYCQLASFGSNGELLNDVVTLATKNLAKSSFIGTYNCIISANKKYFALVKDELKADAKKIELECMVYYMADTPQSVASKTLSIPYYRDLNTAFTPMALSNRGELFFAQYLSQNKNTRSHVIVYRAAAGSSSYNTCTTGLNSRQLSDIHVKIDNYNRQCIVYALWKNNDVMQAGTDQVSGVFSWVVNEKMESIRKDTCYTLAGIKGVQQQQGWENDNTITAKDAVALSDSTYTLAVTTTEGRQKNMYSSDDNDVIAGYYTNAVQPGLFYAANPQAYQPAAAVAKTNRNPTFNATDYFYTPPEYNYYQPKKVEKKKYVVPAFNTSLLLMRINSAGNNIMWQQNIGSGHDTTAFSFVNKYAMLNSGEVLYFICKKFLAKDKESFESIGVNADGNIEVKQILSRDTDYELLVDRGVQINSRTMIFPCVFGDKTLAFAKFEVE